MLPVERSLGLGPDSQHRSSFGAGGPLDVPGQGQRVPSNDVEQVGTYVGSGREQLGLHLCGVVGVAQGGVWSEWRPQ